VGHSVAARGGPATRANENARGFGDITTLARVAHVQSGNEHSQLERDLRRRREDADRQQRRHRRLPRQATATTTLNATSTSRASRDGGWGVIMDFQGYKQLGRVDGVRFEHVARESRVTRAPRRAATW
jgi:hypothetical protein